MDLVRTDTTFHASNCPTSDLARPLPLSCPKCFERNFPCKEHDKPGCPKCLGNPALSEDPKDYRDTGHGGMTAEEQARLAKVLNKDRLGNPGNAKPVDDLADACRCGANVAKVPTPHHPSCDQGDGR